MTVFFRTHAHTLSLVVLAILSPGLALGQSAPEQTVSPVQSQTEAEVADLGQFPCRDQYGQSRNLGSVDSPVLVVVFLGTECPLARLYARRLNELRERWPDSKVSLWAVDSNVQDSLTEIASFSRRHELSYPILKDSGNRLADHLGAQRTPEAFVFDANRRLKYRGRIDDQFGVGIQKAQPQQQELSDAVDSLLEETSPTVVRTDPVGCLIGRHRNIEPHGAITFARHIAPILNRRCVECHRSGEIAPFPLTTFQEVVGWEAMISEVVETGRMPPWNANPAHGTFKNDNRLSLKEKELIQTWIANGCPEGEESDLPDPPVFTEGWRIGNPDVVVAMRETPFHVPAEGVVDYQYFDVDFDSSEDRFVSAVEARPGNRAVVHHIIAYIHPPDISTDRGRRARRMLIGYAPGGVPVDLPAGWALHIPKGWKIQFELHYTPNGVAQEDLSVIGLKFMPRNQVKRIVSVEALVEHKFEIPPRTSRHRVVAERVLRRNQNMISLSPHMHVRGASFRYEAFYPGGDQEVLLDVPKYDFNWQLTYQLDEIKHLPAGTRLVCTAYFDNSRENPNNPDPEATVRWGDQSWEEMMIGFYSIVSDPIPQKSR